MMRIHFMVPGAGELQDLWRSNLASTRLRIGVAASSICQTVGHECSFGEDISQTSLDVILVGKIGAQNIETRRLIWLNQLKKAKLNGAKILLDFTDNHLAFHSILSKFYMDVIEISDMIVVPSSAMRTHLLNRVACPIEVIPDALEYECEYSRKTQSLHGIWFGHASNLGYLVKYLEDRRLLANSDSLTVCTDSVGLEVLRASRAMSIVKQINFVPWSVTNLRGSLKNADFAFLPVGLGDARKSGAGPNRLLTSLAHGLSVFTQNLTAYLPFRNYYFDLNDPATTIDVNSVCEGKRRAERAQAEVLRDFHFTQLSGTWCGLLKKIRPINVLRGSS